MAIRGHSGVLHTRLPGYNKGRLACHQDATLLEGLSPTLGLQNPVSFIILAHGDRWLYCLCRTLVRRMQSHSGIIILTVPMCSMPHMQGP
jgi:hypothetical protein